MERQNWNRAKQESTDEIGMNDVTVDGLGKDQMVINQNGSYFIIGRLSEFSCDN